MARGGGYFIVSPVLGVSAERRTLLRPTPAHRNLKKTMHKTKRAAPSEWATTCKGTAAGCGWEGGMLDRMAHEAECPYAICQQMMAPLQRMTTSLQSELAKVREFITLKEQQHLLLKEQQHLLKEQQHRLRQQVEALEGEVEALEGERALELGCERDVRGQRKRKGVKRPKGGHPGGPHDA